MAGMWSDAAKRAAEEQYGREHYRVLAFFRYLPVYIGLGILALIVWTAPKVWRVWQSWDAPAVSLGGSWWWLTAPVALVVVYRLATRTRRRGYRMPRRAFRRGY